MLRSVREFEKFRVTDSEGVHCGRIKDVYFDDVTWSISHLVLSLEPRHFGHKQVLISPSKLSFGWVGQGILNLTLTVAEAESLPLASSVLPVCKQYASFALASPGARLFARGVVGADPHLRSARAVANYRLNVAGEFAGTLADFIFDDESWTIRYLGVEQIVERKKLLFHLLPQSVERFTWATQRVVLRNLQPVHLDGPEHNPGILTAA